MTPAPHLLDLLRHRMSEQPGAGALQSPHGIRLSYGDLAAIAEALSRCLAEAGLDGRPRVALALGDPFSMAAMLVGGLLGSTVVPLGATAPVGELQRAVQDTRCHALLVDDASAPALTTWAEANGLALLTASDVGAESASPAGQARIRLSVQRSASTVVGRAVPPRSEADDLDPVVLVLRTSGSTAQPKRVALTATRLGASAMNVARHLQLSPQDLSLNVMPLHHSHGIVGVLLSSMVAGAAVAYRTRFDAADLVSAAASLQPTWISATPTIHQALLAHLNANPAPAAWSRLRFARSTSGPMPAAVIEPLQAAYGAPLVESFGMTEWSQIASNGLAADDRRVGTVGRATGVALALLGPSGEILAGAAALATARAGELLIRGTGVCSGYEDDPQATAAATYDGWFRTGDLARLDADGFLTITGRLKEVVNRGGEKVSPREVEEALLTHPAVQDAGAFGVPHPTLGEDLLAAVVLKAGAQATPSGLREHLFQTIAEERVPTEVHLLDALPRGDTGKLARARLTEWTLTQPPAAPADAAPPPEASETELALCGIFGEILKRESVLPGDNFFRLGGDSLTGIRAVVKINQTFGIRVRPAALFRFPTAKALAPEVERLMPAVDLAELERQIASLSDEEVARTLAAQQRGGAAPT